MVLNVFMDKAAFAYCVISVWTFVTLFALAKFQEARISLASPMLFCLLYAIYFQCGYIEDLIVLSKIPFAYPNLIRLLGGAYAIFMNVFIVLMCIFMISCLWQFMRLRGAEHLVKIADVTINAGLYAGFWRRFCAALIDGAIIGAIVTQLLLLLSTSYNNAWLEISYWLHLDPLVTMLSVPVWVFVTAPFSPIAGATNLLAGLAIVMNRNSVGHGITELLGLSFVLVNFLAWLYYALMESSPHQATVGKMLLGLRVVDAMKKRLSLKRAAARYLFKLLSFDFMLLGYVLVSISPTRQGIHDLLADTFVVRTGKQL